MRDHWDMVTPELPTFVPAPRLRSDPKSTAEDRKLLAGYVPPKRAESCRNCRHVRAHVHAPESLYEHETHHCTLHRFGVKLGAICDDFHGKKA